MMSDYVLNKKNEIKHKTIDEKLIYGGIVALFLYGPIRDLCNVLCLLILGNTIVSLSSVLQISSIVVLFFSFIVIFKKRYVFVLLSFIILSLIWYCSYKYNVNTSEYILAGISSFFFECLPFMWMFYYIFRKETSINSFEIKAIFRVNSIRLSILLISQTIMFLVPRTDVYNDYMSSAYVLVGPCIIDICEIILQNKDKGKKMFYALLSIIYILILGCRGALVCILIFILAYLLFISKKNKIIKRTSVIFILLLMILLAQPFANILLSMGINSRTLTKIANSSFFKDENRNLIYSIIWSSIKENPFGLGVMADRHILITSNQVWNIYYAHNIFLEMGIDFGYFGLVFFGLIIVLFLRIIRQNDFFIKVLVCGFFSMSIVKLMISSTLWTEQYFWVFLGIIFALFKRNNIQNKKRYITS